MRRNISRPEGMRHVGHSLTCFELAARCLRRGRLWSSLEDTKRAMLYIDRALRCFGTRRCVGKAAA